MSKKVVLLIALILIVVIAGVGYFAYLAPKLKVAGFTSSAAPLAQKDLELNKELADFFDKADADLDKVISDDEADRDKFIETAEEAIKLLDSSKGKYEDILKEFNRLDAPQDASALKTSFVELNEFYGKSLTDLKRTLKYTKEIAVIQKASEKELDSIPEPDPDATPEQVTATLDKIKTAFDKMKSDLEKLDVPSEFADYHKKVVAIIDESASLIGEESAAVKNLDIDKITALEPRFAALSNKYDDLSKDDKKFAEALDASLEAFDKREGKVLNNVEQQVKDLRSKVGESWVSKDLQFEVEK